jgi:hypothetical protein
MTYVIHLWQMHEKSMKVTLFADRHMLQPLIKVSDEFMACLIKAAGLVGAAGAEDFLLSPRSSLFLYNFTLSLDFFES